MAAQPDLFAEPPRPEGFAYRPELISPAEERQLAERLGELPFKPFEFQGFLGLRRVVSFGWRYDFNDHAMRQAEPFPEWLVPLRRRAEAFAGLPDGAFEHVLLNEYAPGAPIGWHRDRPQFEDVVGVSLLAPCTFRFRRKQGAGWERINLTVEPRSAYLLRGPARNAWEHSIPPAKALRYSITFRSLRSPPAA